MCTRVKASASRDQAAVDFDASNSTSMTLTNPPGPARSMSSFLTANQSMSQKKNRFSTVAFLLLAAALVSGRAAVPVAEPPPSSAAATPKVSAGSFAGLIKSERYPDGKMVMVLAVKPLDAGWSFETIFTASEGEEYALKPVSAKLEGNSLQLVVEYDWQGTPGKTSFDCQWDGTVWKATFTTQIGEYRDTGTWEGKTKS